MQLREDTPDHPVLASPWQFRIVALSVYADPDSLDTACLTLDLTLTRGAETRRLRFRGVQDLVIEKGFPNSSGLRILDVREDQLEGIGVRVANFEPIGGCPEFWARDVTELQDHCETLD